MLTVACVNWGTKYPKEYVHVLKSMVEKNLTVPHRFVVFTDDPKGYNCETQPLPQGLDRWWNKIYLFKKGLFEDKCLFLDLDVVITGNLDELVSLDGFRIISDWHLDSYNSSVMMLGNEHKVWDDFNPRMMSQYPGDQDYITDKLPNKGTFPSSWCLSYRSHCQPGVPKNCKIVVFHGYPKPHEFPSNWVRELWRS